MSRTVAMRCEHVTSVRCARDAVWRAIGMCVHEHLLTDLLCDGCKLRLQVWMHTDINPPQPWCARCYVMRPGGHHCTVTVRFELIAAGTTEATSLLLLPCSVLATYGG